RDDVFRTERVDEDHVGRDLVRYVRAHGRIGGEAGYADDAGRVDECQYHVVHREAGGENAPGGSFEVHFVTEAVDDGAGKGKAGRAAGERSEKRDDDEQDSGTKWCAVHGTTSCLIWNAHHFGKKKNLSGDRHGKMRARWPFLT